MAAYTEIELLKVTEQNWNSAIEKNLVEEMGRYMHPDWIIFSGDGSITTKEMFLISVENGDLQHSKMEFEILQARVYDNTGLIMQRGTSAGNWQGQAFSHYEVASTVFIKEDDKWLAVQTMIAPADRPQ